MSRLAYNRQLNSNTLVKEADTNKNTRFKNETLVFEIELMWQEI